MNQSSTYVSRDKYERIKKKYRELENQFSVLREIESTLDMLETKNNMLKKENTKLVNKLRESKKEIKTYRELIGKKEDKISVLERDILLKDGKIQVLEADKTGWKERYIELRKDFREQYKWKNKE